MMDWDWVWPTLLVVSLVGAFYAFVARRFIRNCEKYPPTPWDIGPDGKLTRAYIESRR